MIETLYWHPELRKDIRWLEEKQHYKRWSEKQMVLYERKIMLIAFQIRSLLERPKITKHYAKKRIEVVKFERVGSASLTRRDYNFEEIFDIENPKTESLSAPQLCNQIIHYYLMFAQSNESKKFTNLLVVSDYKRNQCLFNIGIPQLLEFFSHFTKDESRLGFGDNVNAIKYVWNEKQNDYELVEINI